jgi:phospholipid/cholesterol/gamma-HCH transport system ATP-binding protein
VIEFRKISKSFGNKQILNLVDFSVADGEVVFLIGKSGMGKSVLLKCLVGLIRPDSGEIWVDGQEVSCLTEDALLPVRKKCGMIFQNPALFDSLSVYENIAFGIRVHWDRKSLKDEEAVRAKVIQSMSQVSLEESLCDLLPGELSYGMQKRVSIARTLILEPKYLLFDEPTTGLDPVATQSVNQVIRKLSEQLGVTSLVVSHDMKSAIEFAHRIFLLDAGKIRASGTVSEMLESKEPMVQDFLKASEEG